MRRATRRALAGASLAAALLAGCGEQGGDGGAPPPPVGTEVGNRAPPLAGRTHAGEPFQLDAGAGPTVVLFYRGGYCGLCRERLARLQENLGAYDRLGARVLAVAPDPPEALAATRDSLRLAFGLVSADSAALRAWGVLPDDGSPPLPATFIVDREGRIAFVHRGRNAADRVGDATLVTLLQRAAGGP